MRVICPHTGGPAPETRAALDASGWPWTGVDVSATGTAYTVLVQGLWAERHTFAIVEHDIVLPPRGPGEAGVLDELDECPEPWCAMPYRLDLASGPTMHAGLGCVRFRAELLRETPDAVRATWLESSDSHPAGHWCQLDDRLTRVLIRRGYDRHVHPTPVGHLSPVPSHGCVPQPALLEI